MSSIAEDFKRARAEGKLDDFRKEKKVETTQQIPTTVNPDYIPPEVLESVVALEDEVSTAQYITGTALGVTSEIGLGLYGTHKLHNSQKYLRWANNAKRLSTLGIVTPEPTTTAAGIAGLAATEAAIWFGSNLVGQTVRKTYGVQDSYSAGESIASSVFGIGLVTKAADKVFRLSAPSLASQSAWKGKELVVNGAKTFVSGAALGLAESALRQEIEAHLNGTDRNVYDYMFSSAAGGAFNTVFSVWARTGKWGRNKSTEVVTKAKDNLEKKKAELKEKLAEAEKSSRVSILSGGKSEPNAKLKHEYQKQIRDIEQAQATLDDSINELIAANDNLSKQEVEPTVREEPEVEVEDVSKQLEEADPIVEREGEQLTEKDLEVPPERRVEKEEEPTPVKEEIEVEEPEVPKVVRERNVEDAREDQLDTLIERIKNVDTTPGEGTLSVEGPKINREGKAIADANIERMNGLIRLFVKNPQDKNIAQAMLNEIKFSRTFNRNVTDWLNTTGGRLVQSQRGDAAQYEWASKYSNRAQLQDEALGRLQSTLEAKTQGIVEGDEADIQQMFDEYLAIPDELKKRRPKVKKEEEDVTEVFKEPKVETEVDVEKKPTTEVKDTLSKRKKKLTEKLTELQKRFGDRSKLALAETGEEIPEDADIIDLKKRIKFYEEAEAGTLELERLEAELAKVAELDVAPLGEQRAGVEPKPTGPKKVNLKAAKIRKQIAATKANIKQRLKDIDQARKEMDEDFQAEKAEQELNKKISTLEQELEELRTTFGDEPVEGVVVTPKEKAPEVKDLEDKIRFYKEAQAEVKKIKELEAERARLLEIETGPLGTQRAEITPKPKGPKKAPGKVNELNKEIAFLRKNMRNRVAEIDRARVEMSDEFKAEKLRKAYEAKRDKLQKELDTLRKRFAKIDEAEEAAGLKPKKKKKDPRIKELEQKVKYYKEAEKEALALVSLEKELARVADIEGRGIVGELIKETTPTPKGPKKPLKSEEIKKKIAASRARMKKKLADLERARKEIEEARLTEKAFKDLEESFYKALEKDTSSLLTKGWGWIKMARQLSLIDQLPSVFAGVPTGVGAVAKQFFRPITTFMYNPHNVSLPVKTRLIKADVAGAFKVISDLKGLWLEARRTFSENISAVDNRAGKLSDEINARSLPRGEHALVSRAYTSAKRRAEALDNTSNWFTNTIKNGQFFQLWTLGVRGIQTVDSVFKRQIIKGRLHSESHKKAILEFPDDPVKAQERALELYNAAWKDSDGLSVLNDTHEFEDTVNQIREELLFAANGDLEDLPKNNVESLIKKLKETANDGGLIGNLVDALLPYIGVPIRAVYRGARISVAPIQAGLTAIPGADRITNPFQNKVKEFDVKLKEQFDRLRKTDDPKVKEEIEIETKELKRRRDLAAERRIKYNEELLTDSFLSTALYFTGGLAAIYGEATGSLEWLTPDQRKKNKLKSFQMFGSDYSAALPWSFPIAVAADVLSWVKIKNEERETGQAILTKEQNLPFVIGASLKKLAEAMPLAQGIETAQEIAKFEGDTTKNAVSRLIASYVPIPAQVRKIVQAVTQDGIPDLRGAGYWDRIAYSVLGAGVLNKKTNLLGQDEESTATWVTQTIVRQAPQKPLDRTKFDDILASDTHGNISGKPSTLEAEKMTDYVDGDGMTLAYAFDQKLKRKTIRVKELKNKNFTIAGAVNALITSKSWNEKYAKGFQVDEESGRLKNEGLVELNKVLNSFYKETEKDILKDNAFMGRFINEKDESLYYTLQSRTQKVAPKVRPKSPLELLTR
jgi:DNA repair exonuclease SbcCD ATPase subunit